jgi:hypothetical protein
MFTVYADDDSCSERIGFFRDRVIRRHCSAPRRLRAGCLDITLISMLENFPRRPIASICAPKRMPFLSLQRMFFSMCVAAILNLCFPSNIYYSLRYDIYTRYSIIRVLLISRILILENFRMLY